MKLESQIKDALLKASVTLFGEAPDETQVQIQKTRKDIPGDLTAMVFPFLRFSRRSPDETGKMLGEEMVRTVDSIASFNVIRGFLNFGIDPQYWTHLLNHFVVAENFGIHADGGRICVVEYSSPNTNKPLHLGHIRNNLLGFSLCRILEANGHRVHRVNVVNDRGIHICKSMLAWKNWGKGATPESTGIKGDHLVGDFYVLFDREYKKEVEELVKGGMKPSEAAKKAPLIVAAQEMLWKWENNDPETRKLWEMMNGWVYQGFDETYRALGIVFDKIYYESETFELGRSLVMEGLEKGIFSRHPDGSVWVNLEEDGLDEKLLLRSDGTSVYITQDLGTANMRYHDFGFDNHVYVVGNEQNYHFQVLFLILKKMGFEWADGLYHLSYGMVELPEGKMKSREGTVVDADDLIDEMITTATEMSKELGKLDGFTPGEIRQIMRMIGLGALKYYILKVDPRKNMTFNPRESIDFNGNTGPFIQYTYARIQSLVRNAEERKICIPARAPTGIRTNEKEQDLIKRLASFDEVVAESAGEYNPALIANYTYELVREFNQFYHDYSVLSESDPDIRDFRIVLSVYTGEVIRFAMYLLGIEVPPRM